MVSLKKCKATKKECSMLKNNECYKHQTPIITGTEAWAHCEGIRTPLNKTRVDILEQIREGATLFWCGGAGLDIKTKCKHCFNEIVKTKEISSENFWLLVRGEYVKQLESSNGSTRYKITDKGIAACF